MPSPDDLEHWVTQAAGLCALGDGDPEEACCGFPVSSDSGHKLWLESHGLSEFCPYHAGMLYGRAQRVRRVKHLAYCWGPVGAATNSGKIPWSGCPLASVADYELSLHSRGNTTRVPICIVCLGSYLHGQTQLLTAPFVSGP